VHVANPSLRAYVASAGHVLSHFYLKATVPVPHALSLQEQSSLPASLLSTLSPPVQSQPSNLSLGFNPFPAVHSVHASAFTY